MEQSNAKAVLKFLFEKSDNYIETYATGVYGGIGPHGELNMYFIEDSIPFPESETIEVAHDGRANVINKSEPDALRRVVKCKITMNPNDIPSIIEWLKEKYDQYNAAKRGDA